MKKLILSGLIACLLAPMFALTWNGVLDNTSKASLNDDFSAISLYQSNGVHLSVNAPFNASGTMKLVAEGSFKYNLNCLLADSNSNPAFKMIADCDLFKFSGKWMVGKGIVAVDLGRFTISDISGYAFAQKSDGLSVSYDALKYKFGAYVGYTGFQNRLNVSMLNNPADDANFYGLTAAYVPVMFNVTYKTLFETNTVGFQTEVFIPMSEDYKQKYAYVTLMMNGPLGVFGAYTLKGTVGLADLKDLMIDGGLDVNFYLANAAILVIGGEFRSFEADPLHSFVSISDRSVTTDPLFAGGVLPKLSVIFAKNRALASVTGKGVLSMSKEEIKFHGVDATVNFIYNIFSDLQVGCDVGAFVATDSDVKTYIKDNKSNIYYATIKASLAF